MLKIIKLKIINIFLSLYLFDVELNKLISCGGSYNMSHVYLCIEQVLKVNLIKV